MSPTTDRNDKYDEETRRQEAEQEKIWDTIFNCAGWFAMAILVLALLIVLTR